MKKLFTILSLFLGVTLIAAPGDTTSVRVHDKRDITWYGNYDEVGVFPDGNTSYRQILMHYTMGCASGGCSDWDYTTKIEIMPVMGIDSSEVEYPVFTVDGLELDTFRYSNTATYRTMYNAETLSTDTIPNEKMEIVWYNDAQNPDTPTGMDSVYEAGYYNYQYNTIGDVVDSVYVQEDGMHILTYHTRMEEFDVIVPFEMARVITPYGTYMAAGSGGFDNNWNHTFTFDITEFAPLLKDSLQVRAFYGGWSSGFSVTLDFEFIEGIPPRETKQIRNIYRSGGGGWTYQNSVAFENNLPAKMIGLNSETSTADMRIIPTGHGFDNNLNCAEFCPRNYYLKLDGNTRFTQQMWNDDCGLNPIYPQGGTWIYNRANWCPGGAASDYTHDITPFIAGKDSVEINLNIQNYSWSGTQAPSYIIDAQLIEYGDFNNSYDAAISNVVAPSSNKEYSRRNPICGVPIVVLKNYGGENLTSATIKYHNNNEEVQSYNWSGNLAPMQEIEVSLPTLNNVINTAGEFYAWTENPNGMDDQYVLNDRFTSKYDNSMASYPDRDILLEIQTNNNGYETNWEVLDVDENVVKTANNLSSNTKYTEQLDMGSGCYTIKIYDSANDGLTWWANAGQGSGYARLKVFNVVNAKSFNSDFGTEIRYPFTIFEPTSIDNISSVDTDIEVYPNPSTGGVFQVAIENPMSLSNSQVIVTDMAGKKVYEAPVSDQNFVLDLSETQSGIYLLKIKGNNSVLVKQLIIE